MISGRGMLGWMGGDGVVQHVRVWRGEIASWVTWVNLGRWIGEETVGVKGNLAKCPMDYGQGVWVSIWIWIIES